MISSSSVSAVTVGTIVPWIFDAASSNCSAKSVPSSGRQAVSMPYGPDTSAIVPSTISGWVIKYWFMVIPFLSSPRATHSGSSMEMLSLFWKNRMSALTSVPAFALKALFGRRIAPRSSALSARYFLTSGDALSMVPLVVIRAATPPGRNWSMVFARK